MFESLNQFKKLEFLQGNSPEELKEALKSINLPVNIVSIYSVGARHIAWFTTDAEIKKIPKQKPKKGD